MKESNIAESNLFQLKGSLFTLTVLQLSNDDVSHFAEQLSALVTRTPKFFQYMPVVIDLQKLNRSVETLDYSSLINTLRQHTIIPVGVRGGNTQLNQAALAVGLAIMPVSKSESATTPTAAVTVTEDAEKLPLARKASKVITQPVRSGQQIYAKDGDLIVLASVSHGAELLADGHIHVYGALRGRALAGVTGDENAHIFCHELDAELVSIAGHYIVKDDLAKLTLDSSKSTHIYLADNRLQIGVI